MGRQHERCKTARVDPLLSLTFVCHPIKLCCCCCCCRPKLGLRTCGDIYLLHSEWDNTPLFLTSLPLKSPSWALVWNHPWSKPAQREMLLFKERKGTFDLMSLVYLAWWTPRRETFGKRKWEWRKIRAGRSGRGGESKESRKNYVRKWVTAKIFLRLDITPDCWREDSVYLFCFWERNFFSRRVCIGTGSLWDKKIACFVPRGVILCENDEGWAHTSKGTLELGILSTHC